MAITTALPHGDSLDVIIIDTTNKLNAAAYDAKLHYTTTASANSVTYSMSGNTTDAAGSPAMLSSSATSVKAGTVVTITVTPGTAVASGLTSTVTIASSATGESKQVSFENSDGITAKTVQFRYAGSEHDVLDQCILICISCSNFNSY